MKNIRTYSLLTSILLILFGVFQAKQASAQGYDDVTFDDFYDELEPYGDWDDDPEYGNVWYPQAERDFRPYGSNGYWSMTEYGNTWVSNYDWGWAPFHYGRWFYHKHRGWGWIPGYEWGPAWVDWRTGGGYYGWAPMSPGISVNVSFNLPIDLWVFIPTARIYDHYMPRYWSHGSRYRNIYNNTTVINNTYIVNNNHYYGGPSRRDIERHTGRRVEVRNMRFSDNRGSGRADRRSVSVFRPTRSNMEKVRNERVNRGDRGNSSRNARVDNNRNGRIENRNDRTSQGRVSSNSERNSRSNGDYTIRRNAQGQREMHIGGSNGRNNDRGTVNSDRSNRNDRTPGNIRTENRNNRSSQVQRERPTREINRSESRTPRSSEQGRTAWDRGNSSRTTRQSAPSQRVERSQPQRMERSQPQRVERSQPQRMERSQPQRMERSQPQRMERQRPSQSAPRTQQRAPRMEQQSRSQNRVFQASNSGRSVERQSRPAVQRSSGQVSRQSSARAERGSGRGNRD